MTKLSNIVFIKYDKTVFIYVTVYNQYPITPLIFVAKRIEKPFDVITKHKSYLVARKISKHFFMERRKQTLDFISNGCLSVSLLNFDILSSS